MATIHSFPTELIRHTLSLAYPPGAKGSGRGLCATALVHSSWTKPSQSVMTEKLYFVSGLGMTPQRFLQCGLQGSSTKEITFRFCDWQSIIAVLSRAKAGGVNGLAVIQPGGRVPPYFFELKSLSGLRGLRLQTNDPAGRSSPFHYGWNPFDEPSPITFSPWPTGLRILQWVTSQFPAQVLPGSFQTLTQLGLESLDGFPLPTVVGFAPHLTALSFFAVQELNMDDPFALPPHFAAFLTALPALATLHLGKLTPHQLELLLGQFRPGNSLRRLATGLYTTQADPRTTVRRANQGTEPDRALDDWLPALRRSLGLPGARGLTSWNLGVVVPGTDDATVDYHMTLEQQREWVRRMTGLKEFRAEVAAAGVRLRLGPIAG